MPVQSSEYTMQWETKGGGLGGTALPVEISMPHKGARASGQGSANDGSRAGLCSQLCPPPAEPSLLIAEETRGEPVLTSLFTTCLLPPPMLSLTPSHMYPLPQSMKSCQLPECALFFFSLFLSSRLPVLCPQNCQHLDDIIC